MRTDPPNFGIVSKGNRPNFERSPTKSLLLRLFFSKRTRKLAGIRLGVFRTWPAPNACRRAARTARTAGIATCAPRRAAVPRRSCLASLSSDASQGQLNSKELSKPKGRFGGGVSTRNAVSHIGHLVEQQNIHALLSWTCRFVFAEDCPVGIGERRATLCLDAWTAFQPHPEEEIKNRRKVKQMLLQNELLGRESEH